MWSQCWRQVLNMQVTRGLSEAEQAKGIGVSGRQLCVVDNIVVVHCTVDMEPNVKCYLVQNAATFHIKNSTKSPLPISNGYIQTFSSQYSPPPRQHSHHSCMCHLLACQNPSQSFSITCRDTPCLISSFHQPLQVSPSLCV